MGASIMLKSGKGTKRMTKSEARKYMSEGTWRMTAVAEIAYTDEAESLRIAENFSRLAEDPSVVLDVKFIKIF